MCHRGSSFGLNHHSANPIDDYNNLLVVDFDFALGGAALGLVDVYLGVLNSLLNAYRLNGESREAVLIVIREVRGPCCCRQSAARTPTLHASENEVSIAQEAFR